MGQDAALGQAGAAFERGRERGYSYSDIMREMVLVLFPVLIKQHHIDISTTTSNLRSITQNIQLKY